MTKLDIIYVVDPKKVEEWYAEAGNDKILAAMEKVEARTLAKMKSLKLNAKMTMMFITFLFALVIIAYIVKILLAGNAAGGEGAAKAVVNSVKTVATAAKTVKVPGG